MLFGFRKGIDQGLLKKTPEDIFTEAVKAAIKAKSYDHAALAVGTTKDQLQSLIQDAIDQGQSIQQLGKAIKDQFDLDSRVRSLRVARTELTDTINDGTTQTLRKEGYQEKQWSTVIDGRERETHAAADGQAVGINDFFRVGGQTCRYPGDDNLSPDERINCRCAVVGGGLPEDRIRQLGENFIRTHSSLEKKFVLSLRRAFAAQRARVLSHFPSE